MSLDSKSSGGLRKYARWLLIVAAMAAITYPAASGLLRALSMHGQPDPIPRPWPMGQWRMP
jgi:hypothetical protein